LTRSGSILDHRPDERAIRSFVEKEAFQLSFLDEKNPLLFKAVFSACEAGAPCDGPFPQPGVAYYWFSFYR
jgi:hypothetical protein